MNQLDTHNVTIPGLHGTISIKRDEHGVPHIKTKQIADAYFGLGFAHARDRIAQMSSMKYLLQGTGSLKLEDKPAINELDIFFRRIGFARSARLDLQVCEPSCDIDPFVAAYIEGVNYYIDHGSRPIAMKLGSIRTERWKLEDSVSFIGFISYIGLAQTQEELERLIVKALVDNVPIDKLKRFFEPRLDDLEPDVVDGLLWSPVISSSAKQVLLKTMPLLYNSNNWAVSSKLSATGSAMLAGDPHMDVSRLPGIWHEVALEADDFYILGATIPGIPGVAVGRNRTLAWSPTYACLDSVDIFIEEVKGEQYLSVNGWKPLLKRTEIIERKGSTKPITVQIISTEHGTLDFTPETDGRYLVAARPFLTINTVDMLRQLICMNLATTVADGMNCVRKAGGPAFTWAFADRGGNIGLQVSGTMPKRKPGRIGLAPCAGWKKEHQWEGLLEAELLPYKYNPPEGFVASANNDLNMPGKPVVITRAMSSDRVDRIGYLLSSKPPVTVEDFARIQADVYSLRAERLCAMYHSAFAATALGKDILDWDKNYTPSSKTGTVFEELVRQLIWNVMTEVFQEGSTTFVFDNTTVPVFLAGYCDRYLSNHPETEKWIISILEQLEQTNIPSIPWAQKNTYTAKNLFVGNRFPRLAELLTLNIKSLPLPGGRDLVCQGVIFTNNGEAMNFAPSYRFITDLSTDLAFTSLPGGASERLSSGFYSNGIRPWIKGMYKKLKRLE